MKFNYLRVAAPTGILLGACAATTPGLPPSLEQFEQALRPTIALEHQVSPRWSLNDRMRYHKVPGAAVAVIKDGEVVFVRGYGVLSAEAATPVNEATVFSVGSVSKIVTSAVTLKLCDEGRLDLERNVDEYLTSWAIPASEFREGLPVTLRMIMSHTAGFSVHGFEDYLPADELPSTLDILAGAPPAKNEPVEIIFKPGSKRQYSGGGITVEQVLLADVAKQSFEDLTRTILLSPLGMTRSTFANPLPASHGNIAKAHDSDGNAVALPSGLPSMPEKAASGLWTSAEDLGAFVVSLLASHRSTDGFLKNSTALDMMTEVGPSYNGLGPRLDRSYPETSFNHPGANDNYRAWIEGNLVTGDGLVVLTNGTNGFSLITEIRNAVADTYGWKNNPPAGLDGIAISDATLKALEGRYILDDSYPTMLQKQLRELRAESNVVGVMAEGAFEMPGADYTVILPTFPSPSDSRLRGQRP